jgi:cytochrome b561
MTTSTGYSARQIGLHWLVVALVLFQFVTGDSMTELFRAAHGGAPTEAAPVWTPIHIVVGLAILAAMLWRLMLRHTVGAPAPVKQAPALEFLASAVHVGLYLDLIGAALVGLVAYVWLPSLAGLHHLLVRQVLLILVALHVVGALYHLVVRRDEVMARMFRPAR